MAQPPAVVIIARHGSRLDAADQNWHLSTPTPYDPPLTYGGWNQCRALGVRIATLLHAREQETELADESDRIKLRDFEAVNDGGKRKEDAAGREPRKRRKCRHKIVIHTSPFLRCLQTSVAIAAGLAQYGPKVEVVGRSRSQKNASSQKKSENTPASSSATGQKDDLVHTVARRNLQERKRYRKSKLRVDAFLGEWLNPQYFENITPPPPSALMVTTAKGELLQNESIDVFVPSTLNKTSGGNLWGSGQSTRPSALDDWNHVRQDVSVKNRDRASSQSSAGSTGSTGSRGLAYRPGSSTHYVTSSVPKAEPSAYAAPSPHYAVSSSDYIPRGYVAHARNSCVNVDYQWDSSRSPLDWGDGGEYGEEWTAMHKRFRRGLSHVIEWYSRHNADDRGEDALGIDQADRHVEEEVEDLVVVLVTHGAGCNALIGAITGQPVLLDVGMASLTMAVRRKDAPPLRLPTPSSANADRPDIPEDGPVSRQRRGSVDLGLSAVYEMQLVSSSEHLRPRSEKPGVFTSSLRADVKNARESLIKNRQRYGSDSHASGFATAGEFGQMLRSNTSTALGSIRRPSTAGNTALSQSPRIDPRNNSLFSGGSASPSPTISAGLWTPPAARTPILPIHPPSPVKEEVGDVFSLTSDHGGDAKPGNDIVLDSSSSHPEMRTETAEVNHSTENSAKPAVDKPSDTLQARSEKSGQSNEDAVNSDEDVVAELPKPNDSVPQSLSRGLSQRGLWGSRPSGARISRNAGETPKRRWTITEEKLARSHTHSEHSHSTAFPVNSESLDSPTDGKGPRWIGDNLPSLPPDLQYAQDLPPRVTEKYVFFFGYNRPEPEYCLQQWYPSPFVETTEDGTTNEFHTSEQYMMYHKALLMGDIEIAEQTLRTGTPAEAKALGRKVRNFSQEKWDATSDRIVEEGQFLKFGQNPKLTEVLLGTGERELIETSPNDRMWGIGFKSEDALDRIDQWGQNRLGMALMRARFRLRDQ